MIIYAALLLIICITLWFQYSLPFLPFFSFLLFQCCFFSSLGLFITMLLKNTDISVLAISLYCLIDFITIGTLPNWHHVILFNFTEKVSFIETVSPNLINLIATLLCSKLVMTIWKQEITHNFYKRVVFLPFFISLNNRWPSTNN